MVLLDCYATTLGTNGSLVKCSSSLAKRCPAAFTATSGTFFNGKDGTSPDGLLQGRDGLLYGTTYDGGTTSQGTMAFGVIFSLNAGLPAP